MADSSAARTEHTEQTALTAMGIAEAAPRLRDGDLSPVVLAQAHLNRIARLDPQLNAFITLTAERALAEAAQAEAEIREGKYRGPLHGIPIALKDLYETAGVRTTAGSPFLADYVPERDCAVVEKLSAAGAVFLGKLNLHEWAFGVTNVNAHFGACNNPWAMPPRPAHIPGGSSGGSAAALAAGLCMGSMGSDTRGSIRIPSSLCGTVGLKPTYGRVSLRGVIPLGWSLDHAGPMARCVEDAAILFQAVAGYDPLDPVSEDQPVPHVLRDLKAGVEGLRIAAPNDSYFTQARPDVLAAVDAALEVFARLGAEVTLVDAGWLGEAGRATRMLLGAEAAALHRERLETEPDRFDPAIFARMARDSAATAADYAHLRHVGVLAAHRLGQFFDDYDVIVLPATPLPAVPIDELGSADAGYNWTQFTAPFNMTGTPALALPCGFTQDGLPIGLQIAGPAWSEALVLRAGYAFEAATNWRRMPEL